MVIGFLSKYTIMYYFVHVYTGQKLSAVQNVKDCYNL